MFLFVQFSFKRVYKVLHYPFTYVKLRQEHWYILSWRDMILIVQYQCCNDQYHLLHDTNITSWHKLTRAYQATFSKSKFVLKKKTHVTEAKMTMKFWCFLVIISLCFNGISCQLPTCTMINSCACNMTDGSGLIDLSSIAKNDGTPA